MSIFARITESKPVCTWCKTKCSKYWPVLTSITYWEACSPDNSAPFIDRECNNKIVFIIFFYVMPLLRRQTLYTISNLDLNVFLFFFILSALICISVNWGLAGNWHKNYYADKKMSTFTNILVLNLCLLSINSWLIPIKVQK